MKIYIVDDSVLARKTLLRSLPAGWEADVAQFGGGDEAVSACRSAKPEVMFLDLNMPGTDGYAVLQELQQDLPPCVIVVSADIQPVARERVLAMGAKGFVKKPASREQLADVLRAAGAL